MFIETCVPVNSVASFISSVFAILTLGCSTVFEYHAKPSCVSSAPMFTETFS